jgi:hypothetical protein
MSTYGSPAITFYGPFYNVKDLCIPDGSAGLKKKERLRMVFASPVFLFVFSVVLLVYRLIPLKA